MKTIIGQLNTNTTNPQPSIDCYLPEKSNKGIALIIFPGGAYHHLAEHEGKGYADYFSSQGIACFVVKYRLGPDGHQHPAMIEDALAAIQTVRTSAKEFNIDPNKIGLIGSSAGGHLAAHTLTSWQLFDNNVSLKPNFGILCYPVITAYQPFSNEGSFQNLTNNHLTPELQKELSCEKNVTEKTPPCFLWHTQEDTAVPIENSLFFAQALQTLKIPYELHTYAKGKHGIGLNTPYQWETSCLRWMEEVTAEQL